MFKSNGFRCLQNLINKTFTEVLRKKFDCFYNSFWVKKKARQSLEWKTEYKNAAKHGDNETNHMEIIRPNSLLLKQT